MLNIVTDRVNTLGYVQEAAYLLSWFLYLLSYTNKKLTISLVLGKEILLARCDSMKIPLFLRGKICNHNNFMEE